MTTFVGTTGQAEGSTSGRMVLAVLVAVIPKGVSVSRCAVVSLALESSDNYCDHTPSDHGAHQSPVSEEYGWKRASPIRPYWY